MARSWAAALAAGEAVEHRSPVRGARGHNGQMDALDVGDVEHRVGGLHALEGLIALAGRQADVEVEVDLDLAVDVLVLVDA
jgi:hypothetical protein